jgi:hypothetical protein
MRVGQTVRVPGGAMATVVALADDLITVTLDGDAVGRYQADQLDPVGEED